MALKALWIFTKKIIVTLNKKLQYDNDRKAAKIYASWSGKVDKYEYLTGEEIFPSDQSRMIEQGRFIYSL